MCDATTQAFCRQHEKIASSNADNEDAGMVRVRNIRNHVSQAEKKPDQNHHHRLALQKISRAGIEFRLHPNVAKQGISNSGNAAKTWHSGPEMKGEAREAEPDVKVELGEVGNNPGDEYEQGQADRAVSSLDHARQVEHGQHVVN